MKVRAEIYNKDGKLIATLPVERYVGAGGAFTANAWGKVVEEVAAEIVNTLKKATLQ